MRSVNRVCKMEAMIQDAWRSGRLDHGGWCGNRSPEVNGRSYPCELPAGHPGRVHMSINITYEYILARWTDEGKEQAL